ncbi:MAG: hypothetical protein K8R90_11555 [Candidatus Cloacimonetes bacterium]|nr:hypothetical protein [Candidatus Cloacimonadota bacterium]
MADTELSGINVRKGLPRTYRFNPFIRWLTLSFAALALGYSVYILTSGRISADTSLFYKIVPFLVMFLAINSFLKNLLTLDNIRFEAARIRFRCLARPVTNITWQELERMEFLEGKMRFIRLHYQQNGEKKKYDFSINFPNMLEIVNSIDELAPHIEVDAFLENVLVNRKATSRPPEAPPTGGDGE